MIDQHGPVVDAEMDSELSTAIDDHDDLGYHDDDHGPEDEDIEELNFEERHFDMEDAWSSYEDHDEPDLV